jgi:hypothetical protein
LLSNWLAAQVVMALQIVFEVFVGAAYTNCVNGLQPVIVEQARSEVLEGLLLENSAVEHSVVGEHFRSEVAVGGTVSYSDGTEHTVEGAHSLSDVNVALFV